MSRIDGDHHIGEVADLVEEVTEPGNLVGLGIDIDGGNDHTPVVVEGGEQMHGLITAPGGTPRGAQGFAVHGQHQPWLPPPRSRRSRTQDRPKPGADTVLQGRGINPGQDPP